MIHRRQARDLLAEASVIAEGPGADFIPSGSRQYDEKPPSGDSSSLYLMLEGRFKGCHTERDYEGFVRDAKLRVERAKRQKEQALTPDQRRWWILSHGEGKRPTDLAAEYKVSDQSVRALRKRHGYDPVSGKRLAA